MNYKSKARILELLKLILQYNHLYYCRLGMQRSFMDPGEILNEFELALDDYSDSRIVILNNAIDCGLR